MIELKNVSKIYKSKKGNNTKALDNVTLKFDNKGMTFILGKSGSGKSTLLNIIGGLDKYDSGDMIIFGKSSKDFNQADFDSYRNTYIGFIFQDFNILEDYDVYENIILVLQLQKKNINENEINTLLEKLELFELKHRKVNELSGGQKQRVAIARALIKNPKIILADEPTGNLDSTTGTQVMSLLKEISKEKLVIIVSHDKEAAHIYGDRIIEIQDGKIIKDSRSCIDNDYNVQKYEVIKSKLPLKESFKLGIGSLKHKKIKLFFTILLTICSLLFFSIADTLSNYKINKAHAKLLENEKEQFVQIEKYMFEGYGSYDFYNKFQEELKEKDSKMILSKLQYSNYDIYKIQESDDSYMNIRELLKLQEVEEKNLYVSSGYFDADIVVTDDIHKIVKEKIIGRTPENKNEIVISNYIADLIIHAGIEVYEKTVENEFLTSNVFKPSNYNELLNSNKTFYFGSKGKVKIVGIIDFDLSPYNILKNTKYEVDVTSQDYLNLSTKLRKNYENIYNKIFVNEDFIPNLDVKNIFSLNQNYIYTLKSSDIQFHEDGYYVMPAVLEQEIEYYNGKEWTKTDTLNKNEVILNINQLKDFNKQNYLKDLENYIEKYPEENSLVLEKKFFENYVKTYDIIEKTVNLDIFNGRSYNPDHPDQTFDSIRIIGLIGLEKRENDNKYNYFSNKLVGNYKVNSLQKTGYLIPLTQQKDFEIILNQFPYYQNISAETTYSNSVTTLVWTIENLKNIAFWVSIVLLVFTIFLISNFIFNSIHYRKKEIGVLRALGARSIDTIKIFLWEGILISIFSGTITSILLVLVTNLLNTVIMAGTSLILTPFILGVRQFVIIYLFVFIVTIVSSIIPIIKISKMKPIDAILNK